MASGAQPSYPEGARGPSLVPATAPFLTTEISAVHDLADFRCARDEVAACYLRQDLPLHLNNGNGSAYIYPDPDDPSKVHGYYHLTGSRLDKPLTQNREQKAWVRSDPVAVFALPYLARDDRSVKGLGGVLLLDAARRARSIFPIWGIILFANNERLVKFYEAHGFRLIRPLHQLRLADKSMPNEPLMMYARYTWLLEE